MGRTYSCSRGKAEKTESGAQLAYTDLPKASNPVPSKSPGIIHGDVCSTLAATAPSQQYTRCLLSDPFQQSTLLSSQ